MAIVNQTNNFFQVGPYFFWIDHKNSIITCGNCKTSITNCGELSVAQFNEKKTENSIANLQSDPFLMAIHNVGSPSVMKFFHALVLPNATNVLWQMSMWCPTQNGLVTSISTTLINIWKAF
jgi:hypothetical protein